MSVMCQKAPYIAQKCMGMTVQEGVSRVVT